MSVDTALVLETLVRSICAEVTKLVGGHQILHPALEPNRVPTFGADVTLAGALARRGYLARVVEIDLFEPAKAPTPGLGGTLEKLVVKGSGPDDAVAVHSSSIAASEPLSRPSPNEGAFAWQVPGPGGHVRHYVAVEAVAELLREPSTSRVGDLQHTWTGELKRIWTYGFCVRCCEDAPTSLRKRGLIAARSVGVLGHVGRAASGP